MQLSSQPYDACPYCLTAINTSTPEPSLHIPAVKETKPQIELSNRSTICKHHLGYLAERPKQNIPEECLTCKEIVQCMLAL